ncbi:MAG: hypothetical protein DRJ61_12100 [Acidobacteria bacterium]|nr:MAG: hypothetical protein DRJ61_12100 [Acidobacteriota bacterium]
MLTISNRPGDLDFLTWISPGSEISPIGQVEEATRRIAEHIDATGSVLLHERLYGDLEWADRLLKSRAKVRKDVGFDDEVPPTFVQGRSCTSSPLAGVHAITARPAQLGQTEVIRCDGQVAGVLVQGRDARYLYLSDLVRLVPVGSQGDPGEETGAVFDVTRAILESKGWSFGDVCRTWFYLRDILDWYDEFNEVRNEKFENLGLFNNDANAMIPASTGILGANSRGSWCALDLLAVREASAGSIGIKRLANPYQNEAPEYGSAFSRGLALTMGRSSYVLVSGTASIDNAGVSIHLGDFERQANQTLETIEALLGQGGAVWGDVCQATAFIKRPEDVSVYQQLIRNRGLQDLPIVCTIADVCREELLFELDCTAIPSRKA